MVLAPQACPAPLRADAAAVNLPALPAPGSDALGVQDGGDLAVGQFVLVPEQAGAGPAGLLRLLLGRFVLVDLPAVRRGAVGVPALLLLCDAGLKEVVQQKGPLHA
jgi:hypothetical protein